MTGAPIVTTDVALAADAIRRGQLVAFPTETVYGLGADATNPDAVRRIFTAKGRPAGHPLIVHLADPADVGRWIAADSSAEILDRVELLAAKFWPGPLTVVVPRSHLVASETVGGRSTIGLRVPSHPVALALLERFGGGIAAPSANRFGRVSPTTAAHVVEDLARDVDVVLDGGPADVGVESTIVELVAPVPMLLRPGGATRSDLETVLGVELALPGDGTESRAPGMLRSHYAPAAAVELITLDDLARLDGSLSPEIGVIAPVRTGHEPSWLLPEDADGYAQQLYAALRAADGAGVRRLLVVPPVAGALIDAVIDRLTKAAAPRTS